MSTREILTLQFGHYSNFVGAHWWNLQETNFSYDPDNPSEINADVLYREGENLQRQKTFTPRLLLVDLKGSLGYLSKDGELYKTENASEEAVNFWENVEVKKEPEVPKPAFVESLDSEQAVNDIDLENETKTWTDFLVPRFHPRTVNIVQEYVHKSEETPFDVYHLGRELWNRPEFSEDFVDKIRLYVEECDLMQGFQVLLDSTNGFSGLGSSCIQHLNDEYSKSILALPLIDSTNSIPKSSDLMNAMNVALCWNQIGENASLFSPLCCGSCGWLVPGSARKFDHLTYNSDNKYHSSAILATALDTVTLRYRHKSHTMSALSDLCSDLNKLGRKAAAMSLNVPFPMRPRKDLIDVLDELESELWTCLTPSCKIAMEKNMQSLTLRGVGEERLKRPLKDARKQMSMPAYRCSTVHEMMSLYLAANCHVSATYLLTTQQPLQIRPPFPNIFNNNVHANGDVADWPVGEDITSVPVLAGLHSTAGLTEMFESLHKQIARIKNIKRFSAFSMEQDEYVEVMNNLLDCKEAYEEHYV